MRQLLLIILTTTMLSCSLINRKDVLPEGLLDKETMTAVLVDLELAEAMITLNLLGSITDSSTTNNRALLNEVFIAHKVTEEAFNITYDYYLNHPHEFRFIYDEVTVRIKEKEAEVQVDAKDKDSREERIMASKRELANPFQRNKKPIE